MRISFWLNKEGKPERIGVWHSYGHIPDYRDTVKVKGYPQMNVLGRKWVDEGEVQISVGIEGD